MNLYHTYYNKPIVIANTNPWNPPAGMDWFYYYDFRADAYNPPWIIGNATWHVDEGYYLPTVGSGGWTVDRRARNGVTPYTLNYIWAEVERPANHSAWQVDVRVFPATNLISFLTALSEDIHTDEWTGTQVVGGSADFGFSGSGTVLSGGGKLGIYRRIYITGTGAGPSW